MTTNRAPVPKHEQIADTYRRKIRSGELAPGDKMPTVREVQTEWSVSRTTAERAMGELRREGLTVARRRTGTVVATLPPPVVTGVARLERLIRTGDPHADGETSGRLRPPALRSCLDPHIAEQLGVELGDEIVLRIRLFRQDGKPTAIGLSCIHPRALALVPELLDDVQLPKFWQLLYAERGGEPVEGGEYEFFRSRNASA
ncbi:GntR family transcriptional regulator, partial [Streptomyces sp. CAI-85]|uniref:GntR family transcriptional regulator n=1 Tax=Streptomyces sp. CAI-85 TaxID=1472662 RepID=UPI001586FE5E